MVYGDVCNLAWEVGHRKLSSNGNPKERRSFTTLAQQHYGTPFKKAILLLFKEPTPFLAMLKWVMSMIIRIVAKVRRPFLFSQET